MPASARTTPLLVTGLVVLAALAAAAWLVFAAPDPKTVADAAAPLPAPEAAAPAPMPEPEPAATAPTP